jgi:hypothetical protein
MPSQKSKKKRSSLEKQAGVPVGSEEAEERLIGI